MRQQLILLSVILAMMMFDANSNEMGFDFVKNETSKANAFALAFPMSTLSQYSKVQLYKDDVKVAADFYSHLIWPELSGSVGYVRGLTVIPEQMLSEGRYKVVWKSNNDIKIKNLPKNKLSTLHFAEIAIEKYWLKYMLYAPLAPVENKHSLVWFDNAYQKFGEFITDDEAISGYKKGRESFKQAAAWLYDRPYSLYLLYLKTGDRKWQVHAHEAAVFYRNNINSAGYFSLKKKQDLKYLIPAGLLIDYLFYPDVKTYTVIEKMYENSLSWAAKYTNERGFWTERHLASAMSLALTKWELTGDKASSDRLTELIQGTQESIKVSIGAGGLPWGCVRHTYSSHEGGEDKTKVCSQWMSGLLVDQLWRYYRLSGNSLSGQLVKVLANQVLNDGLYGGWGAHLKGYKIPYYLRYFDDKKKREIDQWTDIHHACDVAAMVAKGGYLTKIDGKSTALHFDAVNVLMRTCKKTLYRADNVKVWGLSPLRKFSWWFSPTGNLAWLIEQL